MIKKTKKLSLGAETIRRLDEAQLERAIGGNGSLFLTCACQTGGICGPPTDACATNTCQTGAHGF